ncbi:hypothetical protein LOTGIDRAFT_179605 [Lottia gigantea]|uniref:Uncharacterized protein n=1 Tax=Lottia gigantea TaxID=225164 RepID=V3ZK71_LOTGI|nr:hypothetical protein LOTGIDRAFT_179605 [Lottia gigantea]ESO84652.1 hypothetical protein LOTGIDRAFT_179605 [Lottia gigantea]
MCIFVVVKLLGLADIGSNLRDLWIWANLSWGFISCVICGVQWYLLTLIKVTPRICRVTEEDRRCLNINTDCEEDTAETEEDKQEEEVNKASVMRLLAYSKPDLPYLLAAFLFLTLSSTGRIFLPYFTGQVIDGIAIEKSQTKFINALITMSLITLASAIFAGLRGSIFTYIMARLNLRIRDDLFSSITQQEIGFFDNIRTGDLVSRLTSDTSTMSDALALNINVFLRSLITSIGVIVFMFKLSWKMSLVTFAGLPIIIIVSKYYGTYYETLSEKVQDSLAKANVIAEEALSTMRTVRSFANEGGEKSRYYKALTITYRLGVKLALIYGGYVISNEVFELILTIATFYYGGHLVITDQLTAGNLVSFILYQIQLGECLDAIGDVYTGLMQSLGASHKVFEYIDRKPVIFNNYKGYEPDRLHGRIEFQNVNFSYPTRLDTTVLKNINISIEPGEIVALVGPSGGGKSSLVNLLQHFYETQSGQILLDGVKIQNYSHSYLHRKISMVGQEPVLYARTISENISYGLEEEFSQADILNAAKLANAHDFITKMTKSYETETGEKGLQISGGQKQRIAIARALIRNPVVLILDEATSALDSESEHVVQQAIYSNVKGRTVLIIAHRLSTVESADRIIVINQGQVAEEGRHEELLARGGMYANLVKRQLNTLDMGSSKSQTDITASVFF